MIHYFHSDLLNKDCKLDTETGEVTVKELSDIGNKYITYNKSECDIITGEMDPIIHTIKRMFDCEIVDYTPPVKLDMQTKHINNRLKREREYER